ncbi:MAG TPA: hypothetical protein VN750_08055 [Steroidobacteraceae bacterium]|nr:hypothetical protein [Steroidobacteraceae bacterium]
MAERIIVKVQLSDGKVVEYTIELATGLPWKLIVQGIDRDGQKEFVADDLFDAQLLLREELEAAGALLLCAGARSDVFPSGMSRSMSGGRKAYMMQLGKSPSRSDLVDIFSYAEPGVVGTVRQQQQFHQKWIESRS